MAYFNKFRDTKGFISLWERVIRFKYMITKEAKERTRILAFWERHGTEATVDAFRISRATLYRYQKSLKEGHGKLESLNKKGTAPKKRRKRNVTPWVEKTIIDLRTSHPRLGKEKLCALLGKKGYTGSVSTVGRIIFDLKEKGKLPQKVRYSLYGNTGHLIERKPRKQRKKYRRPKGVRVLEVDTIVRYLDGVKRYTLTAVDTETRVAFAGCYTNHGSASAADFLRKCYEALPDPPPAVQTDNGSEFAKYFDRACSALDLKRFHTYPHSPKMNAHVERFNRTLSEEFLIFHRALQRDDVEEFNRQLVDWLIWYNTERPHHALGLKSPYECMIERLLKKSQRW